jgi:hypothetical protein
MAFSESSKMKHAGKYTGQYTAAEHELTQILLTELLA